MVNAKLVISTSFTKNIKLCSRMTKTLYLDHQATTPVENQVLTAMSEYWGKSFGNPHSNGHVIGWNAEKAINRAQQQIADAIGAERDEIVFTSGATESNNLAVYALCEMGKNSHERRQILVSPLEHKCVLNAVSYWAEKFDYEVVLTQTDDVGVVDLKWLEGALETPTLFCSIGYVNNEIGTIQPLEKISELLRQNGVLFHSDCAQAPKTLSCDQLAHYVDLASFSGHKIGGPPGIGALFISGDLQEQFTSLIQGGGQQLGLRSGTLPLPLCVGLGAAFDLLNKDDFEEGVRELSRLRDYFYEQLRLKDLNVTLNGPRLDERHAGNLNITFNGTKALDLLMAAQPSLAASTGSACGSGQIEPSHVLMALGFSKERAESSLRFSFSRQNTFEELDAAVQILSEKIDFLNSMAVD